MKYDVFISYSRADLCFEDNTINPDSIVSKVLKTLDNNNISYWIDLDGIYCGNEFAEKIALAIEESRVFLFISTQTSNNSKWTAREIGCAANIDYPIIPFRVNSDPYPTKIRLFLAHLDFIDYHKLGDKSYEELVASINRHLVVIKEKEAEEQRKQELASEKHKAEERQKLELIKMQTQFDAKCSLIQDEIAAKQAKLQSLLQSMKEFGLDTSDYDEVHQIKMQEDVEKKEQENIRLKGEIEHLLQACEELKRIVKDKSNEIINIEQRYAELDITYRNLLIDIKEGDCNEEKFLVKNYRTKGYMFLFMLTSIVLLLAIIPLYIAYDSKLDYGRYMYREYHDVKEVNDSLTNQIKKSIVPIVIKDIEFCTYRYMHEKEFTYLRHNGPYSYKKGYDKGDEGRQQLSGGVHIRIRLMYKSLENISLNFKYRLINPDGSLQRNYTDSDIKNISFRKGNDNTIILDYYGYCPKDGRYKIEMYYNEICVGSVQFNMIKRNSEKEKSDSTDSPYIR